MGKMKLLICGAVFASVILGAFGYPSNQSPAEGEASPVENSREGKQFFTIPNLIGASMNFDMNTNGAPIIPNPSYFNFSTNYDGGVGGTGSFVMPWHFPFFLFSAYPPLNFTVGVNATNKLDVNLNAGAGNNSTNNNQTTGSLDVDVDLEIDITKRKATYLGHRPIGSSIIGDPKPVANSRPNPNHQSPGSGINVADAMQAATSVAEHQAGNHTFENSAVGSVVLSQAPSSENDLTHVHFEQGHAAQAASVPAAMGNIAVPDAELMEALPEAQMPTQQIVQGSPGALVVDQDKIPSSQQDKLSGKSRRHAGVERPTALRIEDFEDVENSETGIPHHSELIHEVTAYDSSKEEMILLAMEQAQQMVPGMHFSAPRPAPPFPGPINTVPLGVQHRPNPYAEERPVSGEHVKHKPRPYGMDPAKNKPKGRPTLDGGMKEKDKELHFGLPHAPSSSSSPATDFGIQKEQMESEGASVFGFQIPVMKWSAFTNVFQNILGSRKKSSMGKADMIGERDDASPKDCVDDEEAPISISDLAKSPTISGGRLCANPEAQKTCTKACVDNGFKNGTCLGPMTTPGCLCQMQSHKEYGMMLTPLESSSPVREDPVRCKKCACADSCKRSHSYTGFCVDRCYCAVPWYKKEA